MKPGLVLPRFYPDDAIQGERVDRCIKTIAEQLNGGLTEQNLSSSLGLSTGAFVEGRNVFTMTLSMPSAASVASGGGTLNVPARIVGIQWTSLLTTNTAAIVVEVAINNNAITLMNFTVPSGSYSTSPILHPNAPVLLTANPVLFPSSLTAPATYYYEVSALGPGWIETSPSNELSIFLPSNQYSVRLTWSAALDGYSNPPAPDPFITGYRVYRGTTAGGENVYYTSSGGGTLSFIDSGAASTGGSPTIAPSLYATGFRFVDMATDLPAGTQFGLPSGNLAQEVTLYFSTAFSS